MYYVLAAQPPEMFCVRAAQPPETIRALAAQPYDRAPFERHLFRLERHSVPLGRHVSPLHRQSIATGSPPRPSIATGSPSRSSDAIAPRRCYWSSNRPPPANRGLPEHYRVATACLVAVGHERLYPCSYPATLLFISYPIYVFGFSTSQAFQRAIGHLHTY